MNAYNEESQNVDVFIQYLHQTAYYDAAEPMEISVQTVYQGVISKEDLQLLIWIYYDEDPYAGVAERPGISLAACKKRVQRAKLKLKEALEEKN